MREHKKSVYEIQSRTAMHMRINPTTVATEV
jgi:hypothetical protein